MRGWLVRGGLARLLAGGLVAGMLAACGPDDGGGAASAAVRLVSQTAGGGRTAARATRLPDQAAVDRYLAALDGALAAKVRAAIADGGGPDPRLFAQVVAVGCDVPPGATADVGDGDGAGDGAGEVVVLRPEPVPSPRPECFAPVTTVALARLPVPAAGY